MAYVSEAGTDHIPSEEEEVIQKTVECLEDLVSSSNGGLNCGAGFVTGARAQPLLEWYAGDFLGMVVEQAVISVFDNKQWSVDVTSG